MTKVFQNIAMLVMVAFAVITNSNVSAKCTLASDCANDKAGKCCWGSGECGACAQN